MRVSKDVVFDELTSWYADVKDELGADVKDHVVAENAKQQSQTLSGPQESNGSKFIENPWSGRLRTSPASSSNVS